MKKESESMEFTGERFVPEVHGNIALEHFHRYAMACELAKDKHVLDIACGEGYGSAMLAELAHRVIGVDISKNVVNYARGKYKTGNLEFKVGSCSKIPIKNASVDLVVSFETIEHHDQHESMMGEIKRVLRPHGALIISCPEKNEYSIEPAYSNPYHVKELYREEFEKLLAARFQHVAIYGQRVIYGSGIFVENSASGLRSYFRTETGVGYSPGIIKPIYLIAIASDLSVPQASSGLFEQPLAKSEVVLSWKKVVKERNGQITALTREHERATAWVKSLDAELADTRQRLAEFNTEITNLNRTVTHRDAQIAILNQAVADRDGQVASLTQTIVERERPKWPP